jgi:NADPH:quinone reductase-like Zn-dependent oxidoreductase
MVYDRYGSPDVLKLRDVAEPTVGDDDVLVRVHASSMNSWDWDLLRGKPILSRLGGFRKPAHPILGADIAGRVEAVGRTVVRFRPGDEVFGDISDSGWGGFAEYVSVPDAALAPKPKTMTFEQAAALSQAGILAVQGLRYQRPVRPGDAVLINGAGGGVGTLAVQIATSLGARVTGVDSGEKLDLLRSLGAAHVIDYQSEDFTETGQRYDRILDVVARHSAGDYRRVLGTDGVCALVGGALPTLFTAALMGSLPRKTGNQKIGLVRHKPNSADLVSLSEYFDSGAAVPVIDRSYPLAEAPEAFRYFGTGRVQGKVVITI